MSVEYLTWRIFINNNLLLIDVFLLIVFGLHLFRDLKYPGWYKRAENRAAIGLMVWITGHLIHRFWTIVLADALLGGRDIFYIENQYPIALVAAIITMIGAACVARVWSPKEWGHWPWMIGLPAVLLLSWLIYLVMVQT